jgi:hypothetical protein
VSPLARGGRWSRRRRRCARRRSPPPPSCTDWTRLVLLSVLTGHEASVRAAKRDDENAVTLATIHQCKGLEVRPLPMSSAIVRCLAPSSAILRYLRLSCAILHHLDHFTDSDGSAKRAVWAYLIREPLRFLVAFGGGHVRTRRQARAASPPALTRARARAVAVGVSRALQQRGTPAIQQRAGASAEPQRPRATRKQV